jgi:pimeloyl-ACP methyl ester carboxylesterase
MNIVLVHGAWADGSCWDKVNLLLRDRGFRVTAAQIPLTSLDDDIGVTRRLLSDHPSPTLLVGHSYGGAVITGAAEGLTNVKGLVYITAFGLDVGESLDSLTKTGPLSPGSSAIEGDAHGYLWINREKFRSAFAADVAVDEAYLLGSAQRPLHLNSFTGVELVAAWKSLPSWYLVCTDDQMIPPAAQEAMATRMGATIRHAPASHAAFLSRPDDVAEIIMAAAEGVSKLPAHA